jgi:hypothetical protein
MFIRGVPYAPNRAPGRKDGLREWSAAVKDQTARLRKVRGPCKIRVGFRLPPNKYLSDHPYGIDLDNLLKRFFDPLHETVFAGVPGQPPKLHTVRPGESTSVDL